MHKLIIFGGTSEGRLLCEYCSLHAIDVLYVTATQDGCKQVDGLQHVTCLAKRLDSKQMHELFLQNAPKLVLDATHPYALEVGENIKKACADAFVELVRVERDIEEEKEFDNISYFDNWEDIVSHLALQEGNIFAAVGAKHADMLAELPDFKTRVWIRILPSMDSLGRCLELGFPPKHVICMYGPFTDSMNRAMFEFSNAKLLITKNSGMQGGFDDKISAALNMGMKVIIYTDNRKSKEGGISLEKAYSLLQSIKRRVNDENEA